MWRVLEIYGVGGRVLTGMKCFYEQSSYFVRVAGRVSGCSSVSVILDVSMSVKYLHG